MATSGRGLRRLGVAATVAAALVPASACGSGGEAGTVGHGGRPWCEARSGAAWRSVLEKHLVPLSRAVSLDPWALAHDGRSFFATVYSPGFSGVARIDATTGRETEIKAFPDPLHEQADGAFDGRRLVWNEYQGFGNFDNFTVWAWDSHTGQVRQIGAATQAADGALWPSPWRQPDVRGGIATWAQGSGPGGRTEVHAYDLRTGQDRIIRSGFAQGSFLLGRHLVAWPESTAGGGGTRMHLASTVTGRPLRVPPALRALRGVSGLATVGRRVAYPSARYTSLWWSPSLQRRPRRIVTVRGYDHIDNSVQIGGRYLGFGIQPRVFVGDTRTHRYVEITAHGGWTRVDATSLLVHYATGSKAVDAHAPIAFVPLRELPRIPACG